MKSFIALLLFGFCSAPAMALDLRLAPPKTVQEQALISDDTQEWHLRLTQKDRTQYLNILEKEKQRFWLGYATGIGAGFVGNGILSLPLFFSLIPLSFSAVLGPGPLFFNLLTVGSLYSLSAAFIQTLTTHWMMNQSQHYQFRMLPAFLANLLGQGITAALFIGLSSNAIGILTDPAVAWQNSLNVNTEIAFGGLSMLGASLVMFVAHYAIAPLFGSWVMMKTATIRPGYRAVRPAPERKISLLPQADAPHQSSLIAIEF